MKKVILLLPLLLSLSSCREDDFDILPAITQEGLNTFGCLIDWEVLVPKDAEPNFAIGASGLSVRYVKDSLKNSDKPPYFSILASNYKNKGGDLIYIYISLHYPKQVHSFLEAVTGIWELIAHLNPMFL